MRRCFLQMLLAVSLAAVVLTGCGKSGEEGAEFSREGSVREHRNGNGDGTAPTTAGGIPLQEVYTLPEDFALEYTTGTAGVLPSDEEFVRVQRDTSGGFLLTVGRVVYKDGAKTFPAFMQRPLAEAQCLAFYNEARQAGFFGLSDRYEEMETGGISTTVKLTADGSTKLVYVYGTQIRQFDVVVSAVQKLRLSR